jgi:mycothiol synthase
MRQGILRSPPTVSNSTHDPTIPLQNTIELRPAAPTEIDSALHLILTTPQAPADDFALAEFLRFLHHKHVDPRSIRVATDLGRLRWAALPMVSPGRTMLLVAPSTPPIDPDVARQLTQTLLDESRAAGVHLAQILVDPQQPALLSLYHACGFWRLAELVYLQRAVRTTPSEPSWPAGMELVSYSETTHADFARTILDSYQQSLDCPRLSGLRHIEDIVAGHKATGDFDPAKWFLARDRLSGQGLGVLLLARAPRTDTLELVYLGLAPAARGRGLGKLLMRHALATAARMGASRFCLAVDAGNVPALKLYYAAGLARVGSRVAMLRDLRGGA